MGKIIGWILFFIGFVGIVGIILYILYKLHILLALGFIFFAALVIGCALCCEDFETPPKQEIDYYE